MSDTQGMIHEDALPGYESALEPKPDWQPRYHGSDRLQGKVAIITGADSGIGRAVAALYAREGADIAIVYLLEDDDAQETKRIVESEGRKAITLRGDIGVAAFSEEIVSKTLDAFGTIGDCQDFRVRAGIMGKKESHYVPTQGAGDPG